MLQEKSEALHNDLFNFVRMRKGIRLPALVLGHPPFFFRLASNAFPDVGSVGRTDKKKTLKKITRSLGIGGPVTPG